MHPGSAVCGVLVRNGGRTPVGINRITMVVEPPLASGGLGAAESPPSSHEVPRWVSGAELPCTSGALSVDRWCVPTSEIVVRDAGHRVGFEVHLDGGKVLRTRRTDVWWSRSW